MPERACSVDFISGLTSKVRYKIANCELEGRDLKWSLNRVYLPLFKLCRHIRA